MAKSEFVGSILSVRAVEDAIRATKKYTEGVFSRFKQHPIQGGDFPSKVLVKYYEVYPDLDLDAVRPFWDAVLDTSDWLWADTPHVDVFFRYNYLRNRAMVTVHGGDGVLKMLSNGIPDFEKAMARVLESGSRATEENGATSESAVTDKREVIVKSESAAN